MKKLLGGLLSITMMFSLLPNTIVMAEGEDNNENNVVEESNTGTTGSEKIGGAETIVDEVVTSLQEKINALPSVDDVKLKEKSEQTDIYDSAQSISGEYNKLTEVQQNQIDTKKLQALLDYFDGLDDAVNEDEEDGTSDEEKNVGDFNVTGGTSEIDWTYDSTNNVLTFTTNGNYSVTGDGNESEEQINVSENFEGTITIKNVNAKKLDVNSTAKLTLFLDGTNTLREGLRFSNPTEDSYLIIDSNTPNGSLMAQGNYDESGIGGGRFANSGNITIKAGNITAIGKDEGAGIGGGSFGSASNIKITGGTVTAIGSDHASGIGGGSFGNTSNITITGGSVKASSIGTTPKDDQGNNVYLAVTEDLDIGENVTVDNSITFTRSGSHSDDNKFYLYLTGGNHTLKIGDYSYSLTWYEKSNGFLRSDCQGSDLKISSSGDTSKYGYDGINKIHYILGNGNYKVNQNGESTSERICVEDGVNSTITLDGVNIKGENEIISLGKNTKLTIKFNGDNYIETTNKAAAISTTSENSSLTFDSDANGVLNVTSNLGVAIGSMTSTYNITFNGGTINAKGNSYHSADIGTALQGDDDSYAKNIVINGGVVNCLTTGLGSSYGGNRFYCKHCQITINGGTVTAPVIGGSTVAYSADDYVNSDTKVIINGGSVKGTIQAPDADNNESEEKNVAYDKDGNRVYLAKIDGLSGVNKVKVDDDLVFTREGNHSDDGAFYLYLTGKNHTIKVNGEVYRYVTWNEEKKSFIFSNIEPTVTISSTYATSIVVNELENQSIYGEAEYSIDNKEWQTSNVIENLDADTKYTVYARYKGNDNYLESEVSSISTKTKKSGKELIEKKKPTNLSGVYGQKITAIQLPDGWSWMVDDFYEPTLVLDQTKYYAKFDVTSYYDEYSFKDLHKDHIYEFNDQEGRHYVETFLDVNVSKADQDSPTLDEVEVKNVSIKGKKDGSIKNDSSKTMEYSTDGKTYETMAADETISDLKTGTYYIRYAESDNYKASESLEIKIEADSQLKVELPNEQSGYTLSVDNAVVDYDESSKVTFKLNDGYSKTDDFAIKVNGKVVTLDKNDEYTIKNITENKTITVEGVTDTTAPTIKGVKDGGVYTKTQTFTVNDPNLKEVKVDDKVVTDYTLTPKNGAYIISASDSFGNTTTISVTVNYMEVSVPDVSNKTYTGKTVKADVKDTDEYKVTKNEGGKDVGTYSAELTLKDTVNYKWKDSKEDTVSISFMVKPKSISKSTVTLGKALVYSGSEQEQKIKSVVVDGMDVTYSVNDNKATKAGSYTLTITGTGNFTGTKEVSYVVAPNTDSMKETTDGKVELGKGKATVEVNGEAKLDTSKSELLEMLIQNGSISADQLKSVYEGSNLNVSLDVKDVSSTLSTETKSSMKDVASKSGLTISDQFLDISLYLNDTAITTTSGKVKASVVVPNNLINKDSNLERTYYMVRYHDGDVSCLKGSFDKKTHSFTFETDRFSAYALAYKDEIKKTEGQKETTVKRGDGTIVLDSNESNSNSDLIESLIKSGDITEEELKSVNSGSTLNISLKVTDVSDSVSSDTKSLIKETAEKSGYTVSDQYVNVGLYKNTKRMESTSSKVSASVSVPNNMINTDSNITRTYYVVGNENSIEGTFDEKTKMITFETNKFGSYALAYKDEIKKTEGQKETKTDYGKGTIVLDSNESNSNSDLIESLIKSGDITAEELEKVQSGATLNISLKITDSSDSVSKDVKSSLQQTAKKLGYTVGDQYLDINLYKDAKMITTTSGKVKASVVVPDTMVNTNSNVKRTYYVLRYYDGKVTSIEGKFDEKTQSFTFETDTFSTYVLAYKDTTVKNSETKEETQKTDTDKNTEQKIESKKETKQSSKKSTNTGLQSNVGLYISLIMISMIGLVVLIRKKDWRFKIT